jgi:hypothetical protein
MKPIEEAMAGATIVAALLVSFVLTGVFGGALIVLLASCKMMPLIKVALALFGIMGGFSLFLVMILVFAASKKRDDCE